ncbi:uncharacterized protein LOC101847769 [Aplysia californica]|uniref:Uncharacterized protein LOC101847769 n=1 Tax=Aplysia californica TaxID=6500 RepID=A0ABM0K752_APLCA|nr:uncharacterized protein LOC101847769 [Aplysia californica]
MEAAGFNEVHAQRGVSYGRKRLRPLLINLLDANQLPGLEWIDKEKKIWRLPWKTHKQSVLHEPDGIVLQAIAKVMWPHEENLSKWKELLRNALKSLKDIELIEEDKTKLFKIYQFLEEKPKKRHKKPIPPTSTRSGFTGDIASATASCRTSEGPYDDFLGRPQVQLHDFTGHLEGQFTGFPFTGNPVNQGYRSRSPIRDDLGLPLESAESNISGDHSLNLAPDSDDQRLFNNSQGQSDLSTSSSNVFTPEAGFYDGRFRKIPDFKALFDSEQNNSPDEHVVPNENKAENDISFSTLNLCVTQKESSHHDLHATENSVAVNKICGVDKMSVPLTHHELQSSPLPVGPLPECSLPVLPVQPNQNEQPLLTVEVYYHRYLVVRVPVQKPSFTICHSFNQYDSREIQRIDLGKSDLYPGLKEELKEKHVVIDDVLGAMKRGVLFSVRNHDIYATRHCKARVVSQILPKNPSGKILERHSEIQIFEYETGFVPLLQRSLRSSSGHAKMPECVVRLSVGSKDGIIDDRPGIITVKIYHELARQQLKFEEDNRFPSNAPECSKSDSYDDVVNSLQNLMTGEDGEGDE